jgi:hypothetical protein
MKSIPEVIAAGLLVATATLAGAQTPAESFADRFEVMQSYSGTGPAYHPAPTFSDHADDPVTGLTESQMQALSNEDPTWQSDVAPVHSNGGGPTFAQTNPHGLPFEYYEAISSNSHEFKFPAEAGAPAYGTAATGDIAASHAQNAASTRTSSTSPVSGVPESQIN